MGKHSFHSRPPTLAFRISPSPLKQSSKQSTCSSNAQQRISRASLHQPTHHSSWWSAHLRTQWQNYPSLTLARLSTRCRQSASKVESFKWLRRLDRSKSSLRICLTQRCYLISAPTQCAATAESASTISSSRSTTAIALLEEGASIVPLRMLPSSK